MKTLPFLSVLLSFSAFAWGPAGVDDAGCLLWDADTVADAGLQPLPDGGFVGPAGACITLVETHSDHFRSRPEPQWPVPDLSDLPPGHTPQSTVPWLEPLDPGKLPTPYGSCHDGQGWSFEGSYEGWVGTGLFGDGRQGPIFGNDVHIDRLRPPGYVPTGGANGMDVLVGGDYWQYSRDVNQVGAWWIGSSDRRKPSELPGGGRYPETDVGTLVSPAFVVKTSRLTFRIGGAYHASQRVELQVRPTAAVPQATLQASADGLGVSEFAPGFASVSSLDGAWVVVRASTSLVEHDSMDRTVVWDVSPYVGLTARLKVVDAPRGDGGMAHVNVDHFLCTNATPPGTSWLRKTVDGVTTAAKVGSVIAPQRLWGVTDTHAHAVANTAFGGHFFWGDPTDDLERVYDCRGGLPAITLRDGGVLREAITTSSVEAECHVNFGVVLFLTTMLTIDCNVVGAGLAAIPVAGPALAGIFVANCLAAATQAGAALMALPVMQNYTLHGASAPTSGRVELGDWLQSLAKLLTAEGEETPALGAPGAIESIDHDLPDGTHSGHSLGPSHQSYQHQFIRRAIQGGLRLVVMDSINGRVMQGVLDKRTDYDDWQAIRDGVISMRRLVACSNDPHFLPGPLCGVADLARNPGEARRIIASGRLAIILGTEVDELGKPRPAHVMALFGRAGQQDSLEKQVDDLWALGIRKVTPIHGIDNPLGGAAFFNDIYNLSNHFHNLSRAAGHEEPWVPGAKFALPAGLVDPLAGLVLGTWDVGQHFVPDDAPHSNDGYLTPTFWPPADWIGGQADVTFRFKEPQEAVRLNNLGWLLGAAPGGVVPNSQCSLENVHLPVPNADAPNATARYANIPGGHLNEKGLTDEGEAFLRLLMARGMTIDLDHFSQRSRVDAYQIAELFSVEAGKPGVNHSGDYATFGVHTWLRGMEERGHEGERTPAEFERLRATGAVVSPAAFGTHLTAAGLAPVVNNCEASTSSWARKYFAIAQQMRGHGVAVSTDLMGMAGVMSPRFGMKGCSGQMNQQLEQHDWANAVDYEDYASRVVGANADGTRVVLARASFEWRDDRAPRPAADEHVTVGGARQLAPLKKFRNPKDANARNTGWDYNLDGLKHIGLYPDFFQDARNVGLSWELLSPAFTAAEDFVAMWEKNCALANSWRATQGLPAIACTGTSGGWWAP
ncbi:MAG: hypothetical protein ACOZQL_04740 [Myxococcota bacterium]